MIKFNELLSEQSVYLRYLHALKLSQRVAHDRLSRICFIDYDREIALVAVRKDQQTGRTEVIGVGRLIKLRDKAEAEFALLVTDQYQKAGLGTELLKHGTTVIDTFVYTYDADGGILTAANSQGTYTLSYDSDEQVTKVIEPFSVSLSFSYDADGDRTAVTDSFGGVENSSYNADNLLDYRVYDSGTAEVAGMGWTYNSDNQVTTEYFDGPGGPGTPITTGNFSYDADGNVTALTYSGLTSGYITYAMNYDADNELTQRVDHNTTSQFHYDNAGQLTSAVATGSYPYSYSYSYDSAGNRNSSGYSTTTGNEMTTDGTYTYTYDNAGNETSKYKTGDSFTFSYDNANHLTSSVETNSGVTTSAVFKYDVFGNMIEEDVISGSISTTSRYAYDDWDPAKMGAIGNAGHSIWAALSSSNALTTRVFQGDKLDQAFVQMAYSGSTFTSSYNLAAPLGSIDNEMNGSGGLTLVDTYTPYGSPVGSSSLYGWDGYFYDHATGLYLINARVYDSSTGRWMSQDPMGFAAGDSNLYRYVNNRPTNATDPSGLDYLRGNVNGGEVEWVQGEPPYYVNGYLKGGTPNAQSIPIGIATSGFTNKLYQEFGGKAFGSYQSFSGKQSELNDLIKKFKSPVSLWSLSKKDQKSVIKSYLGDGLSPLDALRRLVPTAEQASANPIVLAALKKAWEDSNPNAPAVPIGEAGCIKKEQGGWITYNIVTGKYKISRVPGGTRDSLPGILGTRPNVNPPDFLAAWFHTHPNTHGEGYAADPSPGDIAFTKKYARVPGIIETHDGRKFIPYP